MTLKNSVKISTARILAFDILLKVESGGYASDLLMLHSAALDARDAGLAAEIVFGVLRYRAQLDFLIQHHSGRARKLDLAVRIALRMGFYQLRYLERVPPHAAVKDSVELVKRAHKTSAAGFVNALLRQANRDPVAWPTREIRSEEHTSEPSPYTTLFQSPLRTRWNSSSARTRPPPPVSSTPCCGRPTAIQWHGPHAKSDRKSTRLNPVPTRRSSNLR